MIEQLQLTGPSINRHRSKQDYGTPWPLIYAIEKRWGKIDIDLAATAENAKAARYITPEEDSLIQPWAALVGFGGLGFLNPEFADMAPWAAKCNQRVVSIMLLTPASIGSEWFAEHWEEHGKIVGLRPRLEFEGCHVLDKKTKERKCAPSCVGCATYPKDCMLTLFGPRFDQEPKFQTWRWDAH